MPRGSFGAVLKTRWPWLAAVLVLAACAYFIRLGRLAFVTDEIYHGMAVKAILRTGKPLMPDGSLYLKGGVFSYLAALPSLLFGSLELGVRSVSAASALGNAVLVYASVRLVTRNARAGVLGAFVWAFHPWTVEFARWGRLYGLASLFLMAALYALLRFDATNRWRWAWSALGLLGVATTLYPFFVWCWLVFAAYGLALWAGRHPQHRRKVSALALAFGALVLATPFLVMRYGDRAIALAARLGLPLSQLVGFTGKPGEPAVQQFLSYSEFYPRFLFTDLRVFAISLVALLIWTLVRADPVSGRRAPLACVAIALGGVAFVTYVHLQPSVPRYLFPILPVAVVGSVCLWERVLRVARLSERAAPYAILAAAWAVSYHFDGALQPVTRGYGQEYANPNFGPTPNLVVYSNFRVPVDVTEKMMTPGDIIISNRHQFYHFYSDREADYSARLGTHVAEPPLAGYMSRTRELRRCKDIDRVMRRAKSTVWLAVNTDKKFDVCLRQLRKALPLELIYRDEQDSSARVYRVKRPR